MDIDIDLSKKKLEKLNLFNNQLTHASMVEDGELKKHLVAVYFQQIPKDKETGLSAIPYTNTEDLGYLKIDMLNVALLDNFKSKDEMKRLLKIEPDWSMLEDEEIVKRLFHIRQHFDIVFQVKPKSIQDLSDVLALIRPNKRALLDKYLQNPAKIRPELHTKREKSDLRRSHSVPYAMLVVLHMHLLKREMKHEATK